MSSEEAEIKGMNQEEIKITEIKGMNQEEAASESRLLKVNRQG
jgi:hypothetical protein